VISTLVPAPGPPLNAPLAAVDLARASGLVLRYPGLVAAALSVSALGLLVTAATVIAVIQLPWLLLVAPGAFSVALLGVAVAVVGRARRRRTKEGLDPDVERRILDAAVASRGRLTVIAAARALAMPLAETEAALSALARSGHLTVDNDPATGVVVYVFPDIEAGLVPSRRLP
jgi:hypothetical protein